MAGTDPAGLCSRASVSFEKLMQHSTEGITDDAMVVEQEMGIASVMVKGGYENIKITTPEDLLVAESFLAEK